MLVVVAAQDDLVARRFVERYGCCTDLALLTPADLHKPGWRVDSGDRDRARAVIAGRQVATSELSGVLVRLASVDERDLLAIDRLDRAYVASEMTAFLVAWLSALRQPVLNRPVPPFLTSPCWPTERWIRIARELELPVEPLRRVAWPGQERAEETPHAEATESVTVVGERAIGASHASLARHALKLAVAVGVDLLTVHFGQGADGVRFLRAHPWADITDPVVAGALLQYFDLPAPADQDERT